MKITKNVQIYWKGRRFVKELYTGKKITVRIEDKETEDTSIRRGVRQGC